MGQATDEIIVNFWGITIHSPAILDYLSGSHPAGFFDPEPWICTCRVADMMTCPRPARFEAKVSWYPLFENMFFFWKSNGWRLEDPKSLNSGNPILKIEVWKIENPFDLIFGTLKTRTDPCWWPMFYCVFSLAQFGDDWVIRNLVDGSVPWESGL